MCVRVSVRAVRPCRADLEDLKKNLEEGLEIERLGWYNPVTKEFSYKMDEKRILYSMHLDLIVSKIL